MTFRKSQQKQKKNNRKHRKNKNPKKAFPPFFIAVPKPCQSRAAAASQPARKN